MKLMDKIRDSEDKHKLLNLPSEKEAKSHTHMK